MTVIAAVPAVSPLMVTVGHDRVVVGVQGAAPPVVRVTVAPFFGAGPWSVAVTVPCPPPWAEASAASSSLVGERC